LPKKDKQLLQLFLSGAAKESELLIKLYLPDDVTALACKCSLKKQIVLGSHVFVYEEMHAIYKVKL